MTFGFVSVISCLFAGWMWRVTSLTSGEGLRQNLRGEGGLGAGARGRTLLVLQLMLLLLAVVLLLMLMLFTQDVSPAAVQEAVQDVRGDHVRQRPARTLKSRLEGQGVCGQHGAHGAGSEEKIWNFVWKKNRSSRERESNYDCGAKEEKKEDGRNQGKSRGADLRSVLQLVRLCATVESAAVRGRLYRWLSDPLSNYLLMTHPSRCV